MAENKHTDTPWEVKIDKFPNEPKEIVTGIGISQKIEGGTYWTMLFDTILPDSDEEYIKEHEEIKANAERIVHCVNHFDEVVEVLKMCESLPVSVLRHYHKDGKSLQRMVSETLKNAKQ